MEMDFISPGGLKTLLVETAFTELRGARLVAEQRISRRGTLWHRMCWRVVDLDGRPRRMPKILRHKPASRRVFSEPKGRKVTKFGHICAIEEHK